MWSAMTLIILIMLSEYSLHTLHKQKTFFFFYLLNTLWIRKDPRFLQCEREDWSNCVGAQATLSLSLGDYVDSMVQRYIVADMYTERQKKRPQQFNHNKFNPKENNQIITIWCGRKFF